MILKGSCYGRCKNIKGTKYRHFFERGYTMAVYYHDRVNNPKLLGCDPAMYMYYGSYPRKRAKFKENELYVTTVDSYGRVI